jgi:NTE family protein
VHCSKRSLDAAIDDKTQIARKPVSLALQGGGSWGAYTWGVLDGLLARRSIAIER